ncbi:cytochrome c oxidase accessory protein CcoG [Cellvibrio japonicus]|uniref:Iron-sulfur cluster-binding protein n=1 Tax=Cellvibrio japonicus (strain Ueda107) TaxID=498211 RepID=B3PHW9_CELJU|nr:cytochrome c oxidase accessory protein CcoG [Cellvibrio japonicus]ACE82830.1 iron-sulfur cluster-binding protein [Cellvibrio japonicus Ueda107]QEI13906.1 cytochrome c oxidase accessory protein CcoG [Cellvibrio japonicus]QEI17480.1 cytochrome c oxidase accessory protein CcoG [Cellvibrio japonicus]QEI21056.1 cytochrome c oxidase accessory protein CcoG [Cellvibrio japonicus]
MRDSHAPALIPARQLPVKSSVGGGKIFTRQFTGRFRNLRILLAGCLALLFFSTSWVQWNGHQAVLWDLETRQFHVFGTTFWPQDFILLSFVMVIAALLLFAVTILLGRVWCGYACPQSTWTWAFMWVESLIEGDRNQRIKLQASPMDLAKGLKRTSKHALWLLMSIATGIAFVGYFVPVRELVQALLSLQWFSTSAAWVGIIAALTYLNAGLVREKVCLHMCPYARFQSVMFDRDTLVVAYNAARGDTRGSRKKGDDPQALGLGDCVDCYLCVQVCPTGIDIRDGLQMDCIGCAACVDACDEVMDKMGYARGLVGYMSEAMFAGEQTRWRRPRLLGYLALLLVLVGGLLWALNNRHLVDMSVVKDRSVLYRYTSEGEVMNVYRLKITNKTQLPVRYHLQLDSRDRLRLVKHRDIVLSAGDSDEFPVQVVMPVLAPRAAAMLSFDFVLVDSNDPQRTTREAAHFLYPAN